MMTAHSAEPPTVLVTATRIETITNATAQAFVRVGEWIAAVATRADLTEAYPGAEVIDVGTRAITPGFNDGHEGSLQVDLSPDATPSWRAVEGAIRTAAKGCAGGEWILAFGYDPARTRAGALNRAALDRMAPRNPVLVLHASLHAGVMNSVALRLAGLAKAADAPPGCVAEVDESGELSGVLRDQALYDAAFPAFTRGRTEVPPPSASSLPEPSSKLSRSSTLWAPQLARESDPLRNHASSSRGAAAGGAAMPVSRPGDATHHADIRALVRQMGDLVVDGSGARDRGGRCHQVPESRPGIG